MIITCAPESQRHALADVQRVDPGATVSRWFEDGVGLVQPKALAFDAFAAALIAAYAPFIRHLAPVSRVIALTGGDDDLDVLRDAAAGLAAGAAAALPFSIQVRYTGKTRQPFDAATLSRALAEPLLEAGLVQDVRAPGQIVSVLCHDDRAYLGLSTPAQNLSNWAGGAQRFRQEPDQISRAEFKLLEALSLFPIAMREGGLALDLGASPGGWTRVLRGRGLNVVAVDPADLAPSLRRDPGVRHARVWAHRYLESARERFDIVVNDMRMDAVESARVMVQAAAIRAPGASAVMTLKLPERGAPVVVARAVEVIKSRYRVIAVRQLHHNRSEVTAVLGG